MNLFLIGWNFPRDLHGKAMKALRGMGRTYPQLDVDTCWTASVDDYFVGCMHHASDVGGPRRYRFCRDGQVVLFDGCAVDTTGCFRAHDAGDLARHWESLPEALEGQYCAVRLLTQPRRLDVLVDCLGMTQVYCLHTGNAWLISNNVGLISSVAGLGALDPLGASLMMTTGWVGGDRTLRDQVRVLAPGAQHTWTPDQAQPRENFYFPRKALASICRKWRFTRSDTAQLRDRIGDACRMLAHAFALQCPVTGGKDSRVLVSLLQAKHLDATYYTTGVPGSSDIEIGKAIAHALSLKHIIDHRPPEELARQWDCLAPRLVRQNDGMVSLWQIADVVSQRDNISSLGTSLWGIGGEIGRRYYASLRWFTPGIDRQKAARLLATQIVNDASGLVTKEGLALSARYARDWVDSVFDEGFRPADWPDVFYAYERVRRWAGTNARKTAPCGDMFSPFCTRPFVEAAFSLPAVCRYSEPLHYGLLRGSWLHQLAFNGERWRPQIPGLNVAAVVWRRKIAPTLKRPATKSAAFDWGTLLSLKLRTLRQLCMDQNDAVLWNVIDRNRLDRLLRPEISAPERQATVQPLCAAITLCYYTANTPPN